jgi:SagB-type dehydrogenase family enzyme
LRAPDGKTRRRARPQRLSARLVRHATLDKRLGGEIAVCIDGRSIRLGTFKPDSAKRIESLRAGLPLRSFESGGQIIDEKIHLLVRRLAARGLLEYRLGPSPADADQVVIEPQVPDYWPRMATVRDTDVLVLSRFAYMRRRGNEMVLESPRAGALFRIQDPRIAAAIASLSAPQHIKGLRWQGGLPPRKLFSLLIDCQILFKVNARDDGLRPSEGDDHLVFWDFHDLLFHSRSTEGRHANPTGGTYPYAGLIPPLPAVRPSWPGEKIDLGRFTTEQSQLHSPAAKLLRERHSTRTFDSQQPITLAELSQFLDGSARVQARWSGKLEELGDNGPAIEYTARPYPGAGAGYELELYLAVDNCKGLARGFYHYDAGAHALIPIVVRKEELDLNLAGAQFAMGAPGLPQILITIVARFGRISWKYSSLAYSLILKDVGVLIQTLYLMAADMRLGACAIGSVNINLFAKMTEIDFHVEGPVGQFAIGRQAQSCPV